MIGDSNTVLARIHMDDPIAPEYLGLFLSNLSVERELVLVCVGTDRSTGDCLGPLVGSNLSTSSSWGINVYGTLDNPVHALNLEQTLTEITSRHPRATIIAVDACLGKSQNVGYISIKEGPLRPGTGVNKKLPHVGDYHIIGVVNVGGFMEHFVLQNTRLSIVKRMADIISEGISLATGVWGDNKSEVAPSYSAETQ